MIAGNFDSHRVVQEMPVAGNYGVLPVGYDGDVPRVNREMSEGGYLEVLRLQNYILLNRK